MIYKKFLLIFFFNFLIIILDSQENLLDAEIFYEPNTNKIIAQKKFFYDKENNIISILMYNSEQIIESKYEYKYENKKHINCNEFLGNDYLIKYCKFKYDETGLMTEISEYDNLDKLQIIKKFIYNNDALLEKIEELNQDKVLIGSRKFIYGTVEKKVKLIQENHFDKNNKIILTKKFEYKKNKINLIKFYIKDKEIRIIERKYSNNMGKSNSLGFRENFFDIR